MVGGGRRSGAGMGVRGPIRWAGTSFALVAVLLTGCKEDAGATAPTADPAAVARAEQANAAMRGTTFHATGTTTVVSNATVETWYDPAQGLHSVVKRNFEVIGEMICRDGVSAVSRSLAGGGDPARAADYVVTHLPGGCAELFTIPITAQAPLIPGENRVIDGKPAAAVKSTTEQDSSVFWIAVDGEPYIFRQESTRAHLNSSTEYGDFGQAVAIPPLPPT